MEDVNPVVEYEKYSIRYYFICLNVLSFEELYLILSDLIFRKLFVL